MWGEGGPGTSGGSISRSCPLRRPESALMAADALKLVRTPSTAFFFYLMVGPAAFAVKTSPEDGLNQHAYLLLSSVHWDI